MPRPYVTPGAPASEGDITCSCGRVFNADYALEQHQRDSPYHRYPEIVKGNHKIKCSCGENFKNENRLKRHIHNSPHHNRFTKESAAENRNCKNENRLRRHSLRHNQPEESANGNQNWRTVHHLPAETSRGEWVADGMRSDSQNNVSREIYRLLEVFKAKPSMIPSRTMLASWTPAAKFENKSFLRCWAAINDRLYPELNATSCVRLPGSTMYFFNIRTGSYLATREKPFPPFVVASYVWMPQYLPGNPFERLFEDGINTETSDPAVFSERVAKACHALPEYMSEIAAENEGLGQIKLPTASQMCDKLSYEYQLEVYLLLAREAHRCGVDHVWMDSLCINQANKGQVNETVGRMPEIYSEAVCCVVLAEVLRRKLCFNASHTSSWVPSDDVLTWIVGYHHFRVWLLQETLLPERLVTRAGDLRIDTTAFIAEYLAHIEKCNDNSVNFCGDLRHVHFDRAMLRHPTCLQRAQFKEHRLIESLRSRSATVPQDYAYGALGLYKIDSLMIQDLPVDYSLSLSCAFALMTYIRICGGDYSALLILRRRGEQKHAIYNAPSWIPTGYGSALTDETGNAVALRRCDFLKTPQHDCGTVIYLRALLVVSIANIRPVETALPRLPEYNVLLELRDRPDIRVKGFCEGVVEPLGYMPCYNEEATPDSQDFQEELAQIQEAASRGDAVVAQISPHLVDMGEGFDPKWIFLILCTVDEGQTWIRRGITRLPASIFPDGQRYTSQIFPIR